MKILLSFPHKRWKSKVKTSKLEGRRSKSKSDIEGQVTARRYCFIRRASSIRKLKGLKLWTRTQKLERITVFFSVVKIIKKYRSSFEVDLVSVYWMYHGKFFIYFRKWSFYYFFFLVIHFCYSQSHNVILYNSNTIFYTIPQMISVTKWWFQLNKRLIRMSVCYELEHFMLMHVFLPARLRHRAPITFRNTTWLIWLNFFICFNKHIF